VTSLASLLAVALTRAGAAWRKRVRAAAWLMLWAAGGSACAAPFVMGTDHDETTFGGQWIRRVYAEAFRRLDLPLQWEVYPTKRLTVMLERGAVDGEAQRVAAYAQAHPTLVRVDESLTDGQFALFVAQPTPALQRLKDLPSAGVGWATKRANCPSVNDSSTRTSVGCACA